MAVRSGEQTSRVAVDFMRSSKKQPLMWFSSKSTDGRHLGDWEWPPQHNVKLQLVDTVLPDGLGVVSEYLTTTIGYSEQNIAFLHTLGQVLRAIDLPYIVGGDTNLAGEVLELIRRCAWTLRVKVGSSLTSS